jgi:hypothetical protein
LTPAQTAKTSGAITTAHVLKWGGFFGALFVSLGSGVWYASNLNARVDNSATNIEGIQQHVDRVEQRLGAVERKIDGAVIILDRIDKRAGRP